MTTVSLGSRARNCLLAAAIADSGAAIIDSTDQPLPFGAPRLSNHLWLALATCEAIARNGGRVGGEQAASVLREWLEAQRFHTLAGDSMKPLRDLAAGVPWRLSGSAEDEARAAAIIRIAPLAFVLDTANDPDLALLAEVVRITSVDARAIDDAQAMVAAVQGGIEHGIVRESRSLGDLATLHPSLVGALHCAVSHPDDVEGALRAASAYDDPTLVPPLTGFLLGAAGCEIPEWLLAALPERDALETVIEPFAQLLTAAA
jgi:ADP-ribosylglycohydrolase